MEEDQVTRLNEALRAWAPVPLRKAARTRAARAPAPQATIDLGDGIVVLDPASSAREERARWDVHRVGGRFRWSGFVASAPLCTGHKHPAIARDILEAILPRPAVLSLADFRCLAEPFAGHPAGALCVVFAYSQNYSWLLFVLRAPPAGGEQGTLI